MNAKKLNRIIVNKYNPEYKTKRLNMKITTVHMSISSASFGGQVTIHKAVISY